jgi:hypothetical protein
MRHLGSVAIGPRKTGLMAGHRVIRLESSERPASGFGRPNKQRLALLIQLKKPTARNEEARLSVDRPGLMGTRLLQTKQPPRSNVGWVLLGS